MITAGLRSVLVVLFGGVTWAAVLPKVAVFGAEPGSNERSRASSHAPSTKGAPIFVAPGPKGLMVISQDTQALDEFERLLRSLAAGWGGSSTELTVFYLKHAQAAAVAETLQAVLAGGSTSSTDEAARPFRSSGPQPGWMPPFGPPFPAAGGNQNGTSANWTLPLGPSLPGPTSPTANPTTSSITNPAASPQSSLAGRKVPLRITPEPRLNALIVQAGPDDLELIEELLRTLDQPQSPEEILAQPKPRIIPLRHASAEEVAEVIRQAYSDRLVSGSGRSGSQGFGPMGGPFPSPPGPTPEFVQQIAMLGSAVGRAASGLRRSGQEEPKMSLGVDTRTNTLIVAAPDPLYREVRDLVAQLDQAAQRPEETVQVIAMRGSHSGVLRYALPALLGDRVRVGATSAAVAPAALVGGQRSDQLPQRGLSASRQGRREVSDNAVTPPSWQPVEPFGANPVLGSSGWQPAGPAQGPFGPFGARPEPQSAEAPFPPEPFAPQSAEGPFAPEASWGPPYQNGQRFPPGGGGSSGPVGPPGGPRSTPIPPI